ncbi:hypothetical protein KI387_015019, partial [Taxus chinensis]
RIPEAIPTGVNNVIHEDSISIIESYTEVNDKLVIVGSFPLKDESCNEAEAYALLKGFKIAVNVGCSALAIEGSMDSPPLMCLFLHCDHREMAFVDSVSKARLNSIFWVDCDAVGKSINRVISVEYMGAYVHERFRDRLEEALEGVNFVPPIQAARDDDLTLEEARRVITPLSIMNTELMKFSSEVHDACVAGFPEGFRFKTLDVPGLATPMLVDAEATHLFQQCVGFTYNYMLRRAQEGVAVGGLHHLTHSGSRLQ